MWLFVFIFGIIGAFWSGLPGLIMGAIIGAAIYAVSVILSA